MGDTPEAELKDGTMEKGGPGGSRVMPVIVSVVLVAALATSVICAVFLFKASGDRLTLSRGILGLLEERPDEVIYRLRKADPEGEVLIDALGNVKNDDRQEFSDSVAAISDNLMGEDQVAFFASRNSYGVENAEILGYIAGCLRATGAPRSAIPYPENEDGEPYEGDMEILYDQEMTRVCGEESN